MNSDRRFSILVPMVRSVVKDRMGATRRHHFATVPVPPRRVLFLGDSITEADVRLFTTLVRFDAVYHGHFKCNRNKLTEMPNLWGYGRDLYQTDGFGDTIDFDQVKQHYYVVHTDLNPTGIVPQGPDPDVWLEPHDRKALS